MYIYFLQERFAVQSCQTQAMSNRNSGWRFMYNLNFVLETKCVNNWNKNLNQILIVSVNNHVEYFCITSEMNTNNCQDRNIIL